MAAAENMMVLAEQSLPANQRRALIFDLGPVQMIQAASLIATALKDVIEQQGLYTVIQGKKYVQVEGWTTLGMMLGIIPEEEWVKRLKDGSYVAKVVLHNLTSGTRAGGASALCSINERKWGNTDDYARRSMAVTRATGKAFRLGYSWIMRLAGYEATPLEEMPESMRNPPKEEAKPTRATSAQDAAQKSLEASLQPASPDVYDDTNLTMTRDLASYLGRLEIPEEYWEQIGKKLHGRPKSELKAVLDEARRG